jgi:hypothetical protein
MVFKDLSRPTSWYSFRPVRILNWVFLFVLVFSALGNAFAGEGSPACASANLVCKSSDQKILVCLFDGTDQVSVSIQNSPIVSYPFVESTAEGVRYYSGPGFELSVSESAPASSSLDLSNPEIDEAVSCQFEP